MHSKKFLLLNSEEWLRQKYQIEQIEVNKIAKEVGCGKTTVWRFLYYHNIPIELKYKRFIGRKFGKLTVLNLHHRDRIGRTFWSCSCSCGNKILKTVCKYNLLNGASINCGCERRAKRSSKRYYKVLGTFLAHSRECANRRNLEHKITAKDVWEKYVKQEGRCALSGVKICFSSKSKKFDGTASIDRIDSDKGYTVDNIQLVHKKINVLKLDKSDTAFIDWCHIVSSFQKSKQEPEDFVI